MSRLNGTENPITSKLEPWLNNIPDYEDMQIMYRSYGKTKAAITRIKRQIQKKEDLVAIDSDKPRSNEAKKAKINATSEMLDTLTELEAELCELEAEIKILEFVKTMFNGATYRQRMVDML